MATETTHKSGPDATRAAGEQQSPPHGRRTARERLLAAANELFYAEGVQTVGIDRIIERAGVAKASLYNSFRSKEDLVQAYLRSRHDGTSERLTDAINQREDPRERLLAVFDSQAQLVAEPDLCHRQRHDRSPWQPHRPSRRRIPRLGPHHVHRPRPASRREEPHPARPTTTPDL
jgi:AcrR family transcriptional regulator